MSLSVTAYLTPVMIPAITVVERTSSGSDLYLLPVSTRGILPIIADVKMIGNSHNPIGCTSKPTVSIQQSWYPDPELAPAPYLATDALVYADLPQSPFWSGASFEPDLIASGASIGPHPSSAPCPESKSDALLIGDTWQITCQPLPGEKLNIVHNTYGHGSFTVAEYYACAALTGGYVVAKWERDDVEGAFAYDVNVAGSIFMDVETTDFEEFYVGDFVFLLRSTPLASDSTHKTYTPANPEPGEALKIAPLRICGEG